MPFDNVVAEWPDERIETDGTLVHKHNPGAVLVRKVVRTSVDEYSCRVQLPVGCDDFGRDPNHVLFISEAVRQATVFIAHAWYDVPLGYHFLMPALSLRIDPHGSFGPESAVSIQMTVNTSERRGIVNALEVQMALGASGRRVGQATTNALIVAPHVYRRLRSPATSQVAPEDTQNAAGPQWPRAAPGPFRHLVDMGEPTGSAAGSARQYLLRVDVTDRFFFDHQLDHVPGLLIVDAAREAALAVHPGSTDPVRGVRMEFCRVIELGLPTTVTVRPEGGHSGARVEFRQGGRLCAFGSLSR